MACFSTTHFASQDKHLLPSSLRRSGEGAGASPGQPRPRRSGPASSARLRAGRRCRGRAALLARLNAKRGLVRRVAELISSRRVQATSRHFAVAFTRSGEGGGRKVAYKSQACQSSGNRARTFLGFSKKVPLLLEDYFIS